MCITKRPTVCLGTRLSVTYLTSLHELHDQEEVLVVLVDIVKLNNVRVVDLLQNVDFILEANFVFLGKFTPKQTDRMRFKKVSPPKDGTSKALALISMKWKKPERQQGNPKILSRSFYAPVYGRRLSRWI